mmetsp:Transcript_21695/g.88468  ORF Transcript_21695/g.88468 Transcript_21695/m.88468 type:complete len:392 (-) Transcript_21695:1959-3134(-)|eukprot:CAMPEP_0113954816 /NCGR_PEP_ID=MMETSP0011_2-20120614/858_1 /TAXON_ID=101924 /ORGANISM="Rhodosorus marinus" /LENGTH=391 /DNA_ID=CAMNT_0000964177 /DNA_START=329 /DNA_END=1504 /DNA_ORIENTATION=+ /assembly_acc=CAM_ASM_000156
MVRVRVDGIPSSECGRFFVDGGGFELAGSEVVKEIAGAFGIEYGDFFLTKEGRLVEGGEFFEDGCVLRLCVRARGGKGGFGSMLRGQGAAKKTTNFTACRDLSGRRLRASENQERLATWREDQEKKAGEKRKADDGEASTSRLVEKAPEFDAEGFHEKLTAVGGRISEALERGLQEDAKKAKSQKVAKVNEELKANKLLKRRRTYMDVDDESSSDEEGEDAKLSPHPPEQDGGSSKETPLRFEAPSRTSREPSPIVSSLAQSISTEPVSDCGDSSYAHSDPITEPIAETEAVAQQATTGDIARETTAQIVNASRVDEASKPKIDLKNYDSASALESLDLESLKYELSTRGLKCGGTLQERANRLFLCRDADPSSLHPKHRARPRNRANGRD